MRGESAAAAPAEDDDAGAAPSRLMCILRTGFALLMAMFSAMVKAVVNRDRGRRMRVFCSLHEDARRARAHGGII